ncbi:MAG: aspartate dehydrogenase [Pseudobutyrivibrio ruminis]|uniref:aspartate dehydrogenase n=1 Tax=Pseudobutyrivibrio ruminis TaxID=46206 RepID=UPI0026EDCD5A|nr:aspartate dehydrogenase [Pseudobutyrivibrio ruminis]MBE5915180.1 aspartate dehydrogenase [Pseudobutyrivibrio ruminis]
MKYFRYKDFVRYDKTTKKPIIKASICTGEQMAGFKDIATGSFEEIMLIKSQDDLAAFKAMYDIKEEIEKIY